MTIVHLAIGWGVPQLKVGSFARSERMASGTRRCASRKRWARRPSWRGRSRRPDVLLVHRSSAPCAIAVPPEPLPTNLISMRCARPAFLRWVSSSKSCAGSLSRRVSGSIAACRSEGRRGDAQIRLHRRRVVHDGAVQHKRRQLRRVVGSGTQQGGRRSGQRGDHGVRARERQACRVVFHPQDEHPGKLVAAIEAGRPRPRLRLDRYHLRARSGPSRIGSWTSWRPSVASPTCSILISWTARCCSTREPTKGALTGCRSAI